MFRQRARRGLHHLAAVTAQGTEIQWGGRETAPGQALELVWLIPRSLRPG